MYVCMYAVADIKMHFHFNWTNLTSVWVMYLSTLPATLCFWGLFPDSIGRYHSRHEAVIMVFFVLEVFLVWKASPWSLCDLSHHTNVSLQFYAVRLCLSLRCIWSWTVKHIPLGSGCWERRELNFLLPHFLTPSWVLTGSRSIASAFLAPG